MSVIYLVMVVIIYAAFFRLRNTEPNVKRGYRVPGGKPSQVSKWPAGYQPTQEQVQQALAKENDNVSTPAATPTANSTSKS